MDTEQKLKKALQRIEELENVIDQMEERDDEKAEIEFFFSKLMKYVNLDKLAKQKELLRQFRKERRDIPSEFKEGMNIVNNITKLFRDYNLTPVEKTGEVIQTTFSGLADKNYAYEGSPFKDDNETKNVEVISSGWEIKSKDLLIVGPRVMEKEL